MVIRRWEGVSWVWVDGMEWEGCRRVCVGGNVRRRVNANEELCFWGGDVIEMQCFGSMVIECNSRRHPE